MGKGLRAAERHHARRVAAGISDDKKALAALGSKLFAAQAEVRALRAELAKAWEAAATAQREAIYDYIRIDWPGCLTCASLIQSAPLVQPPGKGPLEKCSRPGGLVVPSAELAKAWCEGRDAAAEFMEGRSLDSMGPFADRIRALQPPGGKAK